MEEKSNNDELKTDKATNKWNKVFSHFDDNFVPSQCTKLIDEFAFIAPATNSPNERLFNLINSFWKDEKNRMQF